MKTLILACFSCVLLTGVYLMLNDKGQFIRLLSFTQTKSVALTDAPVAEQQEMGKTNPDAETSQAPVEIMPTQNNAIPVINATAFTAEVPAESAEIKEKPSKKQADSIWFDSAFQPDAAAEPTTTAQPADPVEAAQAAIAEEENRNLHTSLEEETELAAGPALESRRLIMRLNPEMDDSAASYSAPKQVVANSIVQHAVATASDRMVVTAAAVQNEERAKVTYAPSHLVATQAEAGRESYSYTLLYDRAEKIKAYAARKGYDTSYAFMIDMGMKSSKKRFFVMDLNTMTIVKRGMVAHGRGNSSFTFNKSYSNTSGSNCTSLGIYKVGAGYKGSYGLSYRLNGLESTNSNASKRSIILHGMSCIPYEESEFPICQSEGCPSLSPAFLKEISTIINSRHKPVLLWIYDPLAENIEEEIVSNY